MSELEADADEEEGGVRRGLIDKAGTPQQAYGAATMMAQKGSDQDYL